jgi:uncharacterized protein YecE (DUF72 family)
LSFANKAEARDLLDEKPGPILLQFPTSAGAYSRNAGEFRKRLHFFLKRLKEIPTCRFAVEIRNKRWLNCRLTELVVHKRIRMCQRLSTIPFLR